MQAHAVKNTTITLRLFCRDYRCVALIGICRSINFVISTVTVLQYVVCQFNKCLQFLIRSRHIAQPELDCSFNLPDSATGFTF